MGLLTNPFFAAGAGLLQSSGPSLTPVNPWGGVTQGLLAATQARAFEQDMEANKMRLAMLQAQQEQMSRRNEILSGMGPLAEAFPEQAGAALFQPEPEPSELITMPDGSTRMVTPRQAAEFLQQGASPYQPPKDTTTTGQREYEFARSQGYGGTFEDWKRDMARAGAANINLGDKPISASEAGKIRMPDGSPPLPGMTMPEIVAAGGRYVTGAQTKVEEMDAKEAAATPRAQSSFVDYSTAAEEWAKDKDNPEKFSAMQQERRRLAQILAQQRNPGRAPTDADIDVAMGDIPVPISIADFLASGDQNPFKAKLGVLGKEIGITPEPPGNPPAGGLNIESLYNKYGLER